MTSAGLDPDARAFLERVEALGVPGFGDVPVDEARRLQDEASPGLFGPLVEVPFEDRSLPGAAGRIPVRVYRAGEDPAPVLVYFHGGGWVLGSIRTAHGVCATLARLAGCVVCSVDYRLAPEHVFPAALEDAWAATTWVAKHADEVGGLPGPPAVGGDSAGGNLAAVCALRARDAGLSLPLQVLVYPITDADFGTPSYREFAEGYYLTASGMRWFWDNYLPDGDRFDPDVSPLRTADVAGVAPALVITAEYDVLRDEGEAYARRLEEAGVTTRLERYDGLIHGFLRMPAVIARANGALESAAAGLRASFAGAFGPDQPTA